ncbi:ochre suppressor tyr-tRNA [Fusarium mexicanum]|uniref:Ochre suppressor tyr-tRNA n=1 Tax=Fusarium mexicanum TaxID=751941 RepID=A0A8H5MZJ0_9HYPO|nr:ochre suppressor tyr-tRNA [Fusarium mexicanum]
MGSSESKPISSHVWKASAPNGLSQDLVDSLQSSNEVLLSASSYYNIFCTDASRSKIVELQIQARVAEELKKLQQKEAEALTIAHEKLASADFKDDNSTSQYTVSKEIEAMREKLESRKQVRPLPESVEGARNEVIRCLREHDRRPLDCWQEVENFKAEVKKLEKSWVEKVVS